MKAKRSLKDVLRGKHANPSALETAIEQLSQAVAFAKKTGVFEQDSARLLRAAEVVVDSLDKHRDALEASARIVALLETGDEKLSAKAMPEALQVWKLAAVRARLHQALPRKPLEAAEADQGTQSSTRPS